MPLRMSTPSFGATMVLVAGATPVAAQTWVSFSNQTTARLVADPTLGASDNQERDYAWGDVDQDGDVDLVAVRKQPFTTPGRRVNVLFMNEGVAEGHAINGVLVDRTVQYASASDAPGWDDPQVPGGELPDQGFLTPTNDREVALVDVNNDTWLDVVTATTLSDGAPNHIGHPRVYINLGEINGAWQGFKYEMARIPFMGNPALPGVQPRFCALAVGDVTGDGYADLYLGDYDSGGAELFDYNNKLLINQGAANPGYFVDAGTTRMSADPGLLSAFSAAAAIADMNSDGVPDVVKQTALNPPQHVAVQHNDPNNVGFFPDGLYKTLSPALAPYSVSAGDLNNDGKLDLVITDDNIDHYHLNQGNAANGTANFNNLNFSNDVTGFGSQSVIDDLNNDGWNDVLIADMSVDITGCSRYLHFHRNLGNGPNVTLQLQMPGGMSTSVLMGTHNVAVFDLNGDGWKDVVLARCAGTSIWMNQPPCAADLSPLGGDDDVNIDDLLMVLNMWGAAGGGPGDANGDFVVDVSDLLAVINAWGPCQ